MLHEGRVGLVGVHRRRLEADRDEEVDHRPRVAGLEGPPDGGGRCLLFAHGAQSGRLVCPPSWMFRRSSASQCVGLQPAICWNSRVRWLWSAYPVRAATSARLRSPSGQPGDDVVEAEAAAQLLGRQPDLGAHQRTQLPRAQRDVAGDVLDPAAAGAGLDELPGADDLGAHGPSGVARPACGPTPGPCRAAARRPAARTPGRAARSPLGRAPRGRGRPAPAARRPGSRGRPARRAGARPAGRRTARRAARPAPPPGAGPPRSRRTPSPWSGRTGRGRRPCPWCAPGRRPRR